MTGESGTRWWRRLHALAELHGDVQQQEIARRLGVSDGAVAGWREGRPPKPENVKAAAIAYGADYAELLLIAYPLDDEGNHPHSGKVRVGVRKIRGRQKNGSNLAVRADKPPL